MRLKELPDGELVRAFAEGNQQAFEVIVRRYQSRLLTHCYMMLKDRYAAEDLVQEAFLKAVTTIRSGRYNEEGKLLPWLMRIAHNLVIDRVRKQKRNPEVVTEDGSPVFSMLDFATESAETVRMREDQYQTIREHIKTLPETQREVLLLRHFAGMSFKEIAEHTDVSINTALGRMRYALINLRKKMNIQTDLHDKNIYSVIER
jgi:RNA polymerase sigma-70 factor (ECF subfamily)